MTLHRLPGFDERTRRTQWTGNTLPVPYVGPIHCSRCGHGRLVAFPPFIEDALFRHGGYGESVRLTVGVCLACAHSKVLKRESVRPPR